MESVSQPSPAPGGQDAAQNLTTVTLGVTPAQADLLATADVNATLRLALRSPQEPIGNAKPERFILPATPATPRTATSFVPPQPMAYPFAMPPAAPARPPAVRPPPPAQRGVEIIEEQTGTQGSGSNP
jgi:hypothetical protein